MAVPTDDADANVPNYLTDVDHAGLAILPLFADFLRSSADVVLVVEGTELPCHSQVLASESKVFKDMLEATSREKGVPLRLESPFADTPLADMQHFMKALYRRSKHKYSATAPGTAALLTLAHKFDMTGLRAQLKQQLVGRVSANPPQAVGVDAAIVWLKHCQQYDLLQTESATVKACMLAIARQFLQLYISRREDLEALGASMLLRIMQAYARSAAIETHGYNCGNGHDRSNLQIAICEADAKHIDGKVHHWLASCYLPDH